MLFRFCINWTKSAKPLLQLVTAIIQPNLSVRCWSKATKRFEFPEIVYIKRDHEYKIGKKFTVATLQELFNIRAFAANEIALNHNKLCTVSSAVLKENYSKYLSYCVTNETLLLYPNLLAEKNLETKLKDIQQLPYDINDAALLILLPEGKFKPFVQVEILLAKNSIGRVATLSTALEVNIQEACDLFAKKNFLCNISTDKINRNVTLLKKHGITAQDICNDLWVLRYSETIILARFKDAREHNIEQLKTWMVRAQPDIFNHYIQRRSDNKLILGESSLAEYLSERLECSVEFANYMILKQPVLKNKSLKKLKELIDILLSEGIKPHQICRIPKLLVHSVETTTKRIKEMRDKGFQLDSLHMLTKSQKQYYDILLKGKNKIKN